MNAETARTFVTKMQTAPIPFSNTDKHNKMHVCMCVCIYIYIYIYIYTVSQILTNVMEITLVR